MFLMVTKGYIFRGCGQTKDERRRRKKFINFRLFHFPRGFLIKTLICVANFRTPETFLHSEKKSLSCDLFEGCFWGYGKKDSENLVNYWLQMRPQKGGEFKCSHTNFLLLTHSNQSVREISRTTTTKPSKNKIQKSFDDVKKLDVSVEHRNRNTKWIKKYVQASTGTIWLTRSAVSWGWGIHWVSCWCCWVVYQPVAVVAVVSAAPTIIVPVADFQATVGTSNFHYSFHFHRSAQQTRAANACDATKSMRPPKGWVAKRWCQASRGRRSLLCDLNLLLKWHGWKVFEMYFIVYFESTS